MASPSHGSHYQSLPGQGDGGEERASRRPIAILAAICLACVVVAIPSSFLILSPLSSSVESEPDSESERAWNSVPDNAINPPFYRPPSKEPKLLKERDEQNYPWSDDGFKSLRTAFHFQPQRNWMNDPNAPLFYKGWYHLFYQYNPKEAFWGLISWGHAVSMDLLHWSYLDLAMEPDQWYDANGVWTGSATMIQGVPTVLYTGSTNASVQVQNLAVPSDPEDPLLQKWTKLADNPILFPPPGINTTDFRDPTTAWLSPDGIWRITLGSRLANRTGIALLYESPNGLFDWRLRDNYLYTVDGTGMWECVDFYPVLTSGEKAGLDTSLNGDGVKHVIKASMDETKLDFYTIGTYDTETHTFTADDPSSALSYGLRYDYGKFYASKTFYDQALGRRILWGWVNESDSLQDDIRKGWASVQAIPRQVWFDDRTKSNLLQWPVDEVAGLRCGNVSQSNVVLEPGSVLKVDGMDGAQLDIEVSFANPLTNYTGEDVEEDVIHDCNGASVRGLLGPFGLLVLASEDLTEQTAVYFYLSYKNGSWATRVCSDQSRASLAEDVDTNIYGSKVTVLGDEDTLSLRVLVDHSIVETYAQGGRTCITSRVYPTQALDNSAHLFFFNNGTKAVTVKHYEAFQVSRVPMKPFFS